MRYLLFLFLASLAFSQTEYREVIKPKHPATFLVVPKSNYDSLVVSFRDFSGERNGFRIVAYLLGSYSEILDSIYVIGAKNNFDDSTLYNPIDNQKIRGEKIAVLHLSDFRIPSEFAFIAAYWRIGLKVEIDASKKSLFSQNETPGAYLLIRGIWYSYRRLK